MLGGIYSFNMTITFFGVSYSIKCRVLPKTSSDSCIVNLPVVNTSCCLSWMLMHYGQYKQVALRYQAMLITRGALHRFGRVKKIANKEKDNVTIDN